MAEEHELVRRAAAVAKSGDKVSARFLLESALRINPSNPQVWLGLAVVAKRREESIRCLERLLALDPAHARARSWLERLRAEVAAPVRWECPYCPASAPARPGRCPSCRTRLDLKDPEALLADNDADRSRLDAAIASFESLPGNAVTFEVQLNHAIALFNVGRGQDGLRRLRFASEMRPGDGQLRTEIDELAARLRERERHSDGRRSAEKTVLVVDDSPTVLKIVGMTLARRGHRVVVASDGLQAMSKLRECAPDLILLDITMPRFDGYQLCKAIKGNDQTRATPVVFLSGRDGLFDKMRGRMAGSADYITKPFDPAALIAVVDRHLRGQG